MIEIQVTTVSAFFQALQLFRGAHPTAMGKAWNDHQTRLLGFEFPTEDTRICYPLSKFKEHYDIGTDSDPDKMKMALSIYQASISECLKRVGPRETSWAVIMKDDLDG